MQVKTEGLIIREQTMGESDRLVTVLTRDEGVLRAFARKAKKINDSKNSSTQLLCYSRLNVYKGRDKYIINDAFPIEVFFDLRKEISRLSLGQYFCEIAAELVPEGVDSSEFLRTVLNALHFLSKNLKPEAVLKPLVEMRLLSLAGYMPNVVCCANCGKYEDETMYLKLHKGVLYCESCFIKSKTPAARLGTAALKALRHILYSDFDRLFSFTVKGTAADQLFYLSEEYLLGILQKKPKTLDFYHSVVNGPVL